MVVVSTVFFGVERAAKVKYFSPDAKYFEFSLFRDLDYMDELKRSIHFCRPSAVIIKFAFKTISIGRSKVRARSTP